MNFIKENNIKPEVYPFNWFVEYDDNTYLTEFNNGIKEDFYSIIQSKISNFGLFGNEHLFYYSKDGGIYLNNRRIDIEYHLDGNVYQLTNNQAKKDCITYKQAYSNYENKKGEHRSSIESIHFGYKSLIEHEDGLQFYFQQIVAMPFGSKVYIDIKLTSNKTVEGQLIFKGDGQVIETYNAPLEINKSGNLQWTVK